MGVAREVNERYGGYIIERDLDRLKKRESFAAWKLLTSDIVHPNAHNDTHQMPTKWLTVIAKPQICCSC